LSKKFENDDNIKGEKRLDFLFKILKQKDAQINYDNIALECAK